MTGWAIPVDTPLEPLLSSVRIKENKWLSHGQLFSCPYLKQGFGIYIILEFSVYTYMIHVQRWVLATDLWLSFGCLATFFVVPSTVMDNQNFKRCSSPRSISNFFGGCRLQKNWAWVGYSLKISSVWSICKLHCGHFH